MKERLADCFKYAPRVFCCQTIANQAGAWLKWQCMTPPAAGEWSAPKNCLDAQSDSGYEKRLNLSHNQLNLNDLFDFHGRFLIKKSVPVLALIAPFMALAEPQVAAEQPAVAAFMPE